ncbi:hypothetical protein F5H01DRAFT_326651 [Linnemannia elongata]|nr:hypothetical protein F5H01DRAFT_326651 [Linnemannia elongata]
MVEKIHTTHVTGWDHDKKFTRVVSSVTIELLREGSKNNGDKNVAKYEVVKLPLERSFLLRGSNGGGSGGSSSSGSSGGGNGNENYYGEMVYQKQLRRQRTLSSPLNTDIDKVANKVYRQIHLLDDMQNE